MSRTRASFSRVGSMNFGPTATPPSIIQYHPASRADSPANARDIPQKSALGPTGPPQTLGTSLKNRILAPRWPQDGPRWPSDGPQTAQDGLRWPQIAQDGPKIDQDGPRWPQDGPKMAKDGPRWPRDGPAMAPRPPKKAPRRP